MKNRDIPGGRAAASFLFEKKGVVPVAEESLSDELLWQRNSMHAVTYQFRDPSKPVQLHKKHEVSNFDSSCSQPCTTPRQFS